MDLILSFIRKGFIMINMNPDVYEQYIYQKGVRDQLRKTITGSSFMSTIDKKIGINANYHKKIGKIYILDSKSINTDTKISLDDINNYYENNKNDFISNPKAEFAYVRLNKKSITSSIKVPEDEVVKKY